MDLILVAKSRKEPGPQIEIDCPRCGATGVAAAAYRQVDDLCAFHFLPLFTLKNTFVECTSCRVKLRSSVDLDEFPRYPHGELNQFLAHDVSFVVKFLAVASLLLSWTPVLGLVLSLLTVVFTLKTPTWARTLGRVSLVLSGLITLAFVVVLTLGK